MLMVGTVPYEVCPWSLRPSTVVVLNKIIFTLQHAHLQTWQTYRNLHLQRQRQRQTLTNTPCFPKSKHVIHSNLILIDNLDCKFLYHHIASSPCPFRDKLNKQTKVEEMKEIRQNPHYFHLRHQQHFTCKNQPHFTVSSSSPAPFKTDPRNRTNDWRLSLFLLTSLSFHVVFYALRTFAPREIVSEY